MSTRPLVLAMLFLLGCSKAAGPAKQRPPVALASPSVDASPAPEVVDAADAAPPGNTSSAATSIRVHDAWFHFLTQQREHFVLQPGSLPSASHPQGTVFVLQTAEAAPYPIVVSEWDLSDGSLLREAPVPVSPDVGEELMVRAGDHLHALFSSYDGDFWYACVRIRDHDFQVERSERVGHVVGSPSALATDGKTVAVLFEGTLGPPPRDRTSTGFHAITFSASGRRLAETVLAPASRLGDAWTTSGSFDLEEDAAVVKGHLYVLTFDLRSGAEIRELSPSLGLERSVHVTPYAPGEFTTVRLDPASDGTLEASNDFPEHSLLIRFSPDLKELSRTTHDVPHRGRELHELQVGALTVRTCWFQDRQLWLTWSPDPDACASIPKQGTHRAALTRDPDDPADNP